MPISRNRKGHKKASAKRAKTRKLQKDALINQMKTYLKAEAERRKQEVNT